MTADEELKKYGAIRLREANGGAELHWEGWPVGESLQGWYASKTKARKAHAAMLPLKIGVKTQLILPPLPEVTNV